MKNILLAVLCLLFVLSEVLSAQVVNIPIPGIPIPSAGTRSKNKKYRTAEDILNTPQDTTSFDPENPLGNDFLRHSSRGWFPIPFAAHSIFLWSSINIPLNFADNVRFPSLPATTNPFTLTNPYSDNDKRKPFKIGSKTDREGDYPQHYYDGIGILYELSIPIPLMLRLGARYAWQGTVFFSSNSAGRFLPSNAAETLESVQIVNNVLIEERRAEGLAGIKIPIYGAFADLLDQRIASYYYLSLSALGSYAFWQNTTQYAQILTSDDKLRFPNRTDTTQRWNASMPNFNQTRINIDVAFGWGISGEIAIGSIDAGLASLMEIYCTIPTTTLVQGVEWRQYSIGARLTVGWHSRIFR
jgi:hypothetical protein